MKIHTVTATAAIAFATALVAPGAWAVPIDQLRGEVVSATGSGGQVHVTVKDATATLSGYVDDAVTAQAVRRAVLAHDEIENVIDLMYRD